MIFDSIFYKKRTRPILRGVYLKLEPGKICGLFGPNGSGKTTLLRIGAGQTNPTSGTVFISGRAFLRKAIRSRYRQIAYLAQEPFLPKDMTIDTLVKAFPEEASALLDTTCLSQLRQQKIRTLSGGEWRLLELVLIISLRRPFLLLDEPFTGIAPVVIEQMVGLIKSEGDRGVGILITDHYYRYIAEIADSAYLLRDGRCERLDPGTSLEAALKQKGYFSTEDQAE